MTGITRGPVGINSHVPVESTIDGLQESKLLGWVVSILRCPVEAIKTLAGILYSVVDRGELATKSLKNLGISILGSCPVLGALGVTALHQRNVELCKNVPGFIPPQDDLDEQISTLGRFFALNKPGVPSLQQRIGAHLILEEMSVEDLFALHKEQQGADILRNTDEYSGDSSKPIVEKIAPKIADFILSRAASNLDNISLDNLKTICDLHIEKALQHKNMQICTRDKRISQLKFTNEEGNPLTKEELQSMVNELNKEKKSLWRDHLIETASTKIAVLET